MSHFGRMLRSHRETPDLTNPPPETVSAVPSSQNQPQKQGHGVIYLAANYYRIIGGSLKPDGVEPTLIEELKRRQADAASKRKDAPSHLGRIAGIE